MFIPLRILNSRSSIVSQYDSVVHHREQVLARHAGLDLGPRCPGRRVVTAPVPVGRRLGAGPGEDVELVDGPVLILLLLVMAGEDLQARHVEEPVEVRQRDLFDPVLVHLPLRQLLLERFEQRRLVVAQLGLDPVLRVQVHLAGGLPHPVGPHPLPLCPVLVVEPVPQIGPDVVQLETKQAPMDEQLHRRRGLDDATRDTTQAILWIEEVTYDETTRIASEVDLGVSAPVALAPTWADVGRPKLLTVDPFPGATLLVSILLDGDVELQVLEDGVARTVAPAQLVGFATLHDAEVAGERSPGQHAYQLQARGAGTIDAASLMVVTTELVQRARAVANPRTTARDP
jgi:hypothetical protein